MICLTDDIKSDNKISEPPEKPRKNLNDKQKSYNTNFPKLNVRGFN